MKVTDFTVELVQRNAVVSFIEKHHYSHNVNGIQSYYHFGLYREGKFGLPEMIGAMMYAMPSMPHTSKKYNPINPDKCFELRRLVCIDDTPKNTDIEVIVSFADEEEGHTGVIYKATNFNYLGITAPGRVLMVDGKKYHSRSLNQDKRPYGRELKRRFESGDENIFYINTKSKHIYTYYFNKKIEKEIKRLRDE